MRSRCWVRASLLLAVLGVACGSTDEDVASKASQYGCKNSQPWVSGDDTGYERCDGNWGHRSAVLACPSSVPRTDFTCPKSTGGCTTDADCSGTPQGFCSIDSPGTCHCESGCTEDADCPSGSICLCGQPTGRCVEASCGSDADCPSGNLCGSYSPKPDCGPIRFRCQQGDDACAGDDDCPEGESCTVESGHRVCTKAVCYY